MTSSPTEIRIATIRLRDDGILDHTIKPGTRITLPDMKESVAARRAICGEKKHLFLNDIANLASMDRESRDYASQKEVTDITIAMALVTHLNPVGRVIANFFLGLNKPAYPTKLFSDKAEAVKWLRGFADH